MHLRRLLLSVAVVTLLVAGALPAQGSPSERYVRPHFGDGKLPAGCITDRDPLNPDNRCYHMKVGLNALDSPKVDVDVVVPVSPTAERDLRIARQSVQMWEDGLDYLADQMGLPWLADGFEMTVRTHQVAVDPQGELAEPLNLVDPEIVVVVSNPAGGAGIGIDPTAFAGELGIVDDQGVPCTAVPDPLDPDGTQDGGGVEQHGGEPGGTYVEDCSGEQGGVGGNVCFAVNGAVDPVPGRSDFFGLFDLVSHEFGHCLTLGHVGDGADGPWGPTATNDIMAYSTDPPLRTKCVSTLNVEGFALRMSRYLDVNGDGTVDGRDRLTPNDKAGDGTSSFQVQNPADHAYASSTGDPDDCPQPDQELVPGEEVDFLPTPVATTRPRLALDGVSTSGGRLRVTGVAKRLPLAEQPASYTAEAADPAGDTSSSVTDLERVQVRTTRTTVEAVLDVGQVWPLAGTSPVAYSLAIDGRRLDSFIANGDTEGNPVVMDNGTGYYLPDGTATWDTEAGTVRFTVRRDYLADQGIRAPYDVYGVTGLHARSNDWLTTEDIAPDGRDLRVGAPAMGPETRDAPQAARVRTRTYRAATGSFVPSDSTLGVGLISAADSRDYVTVPIPRQASALATLEWTGDAVMGLTVGGGSSQRALETDDPNRLQVLVPWARRDLTVTVDPQEVLSPTDYTLTVTRTTVLADRDGDGVPDVADDCDRAAGPSAGAGCPDRDRDLTFDRDDACPSMAGTRGNGCPSAADERVVALVDGERVAARTVVTGHGGYRFALAAPLPRGSRQLEVRWYDGRTLIARTTRSLG